MAHLLDCLLLPAAHARGVDVARSSAPGLRKGSDRQAWRPYLTTARRCLAIQKGEGDLYRLPRNYLQRLRSIGLLPLVDVGGVERHDCEEDPELKESMTSKLYPNARDAI